jgi:hypothetical protein
MTLGNSVKRWTMRTLRTTLFVAALAVPATAARAQAPAPNQALPKKSYTKSGMFDLPVQMTDALRASLHEVRLYVRTANTPWQMREAGPPSVTRFTFRANEDGEYWFALATVDRAGRQTPDDVNHEPPSLRVVVDRQAPQLQVQPAAGGDGEQVLRCSVQDANPDHTTLRVMARLPQGEVALEPVAGQPGAFRLRGVDQAATVRVVATDLAGNVASREFQGRDLVAARAETRQQVAASPAAALPPRIIDNNEPAPPRPLAAVAPAAFTVPTPAPPAATPAALPQVTTAVALPQVTTPATPPQAAPPVAPPHAAAPMALPSVVPDGTPSAEKNNVPANRQLLNTTRASVEYRVDQVGPSGVGKVEVYCTTDQGQTWQRLQESTERRSPTDVDLPGEGVYGLRLAITNGNGFGGSPPRRGDNPDCWIEVDATNPFVQLKPTELVAGQLDIHWTASDKNLGPEPVSLYYRTRPDTAWQPFARNLKNDGNYRWSFPRDAGSHFYFKVEVTDLAGNVARVESPTPMILDMTEPRASVVSVSSSSPRQ